MGEGYLVDTAECVIFVQQCFDVHGNKIEEIVVEQSFKTADWLSS